MPIANLIAKRFAENGPMAWHHTRRFDLSSQKKNQILRGIQIKLTLFLQPILGFILILSQEMQSIINESAHSLAEIGTSSNFLAAPKRHHGRHAFGPADI